MNNIYYILEFLIWNGNLPNTTTEMFNVENDGTGDSIVNWTSQDTQPTTQQLTFVSNTQAFANYLSNRTSIRNRQAAKAFIQDKSPTARVVKALMRRANITLQDLLTEIDNES